jgi:hypothetical protein
LSVSFNLNWTGLIHGLNGPLVWWIVMCSWTMATKMADFLVHPFCGSSELPSSSQNLRCAVHA